jgi:hypothetical protein
VTAHTEYALRSPRIFQVFNLSPAVPASEASSTKRLIASEDSQILNFVPARRAAVGTAIANE